MRADPRFVRERSRGGGAQPAALPFWEPAIPGGRCPPVIEEWLRASRVRLLRRYGGITAPSAATLGRR